MKEKERQDRKGTSPHNLRKLHAFLLSFLSPTRGEGEYCPGFFWLTTWIVAAASWTAGAVLPLFLCEAMLRTSVVGSLAPDAKAPAWLAHSKVLSSNTANLFRTVLEEGTQKCTGVARNKRMILDLGPVEGFTLLLN